MRCCRRCSAASGRWISGTPTVLLHGIGGAGKSTLAQLVRGLGPDAGLVVSVHGTTTVEQILDETGRRLLAAVESQPGDEAERRRQLATDLRTAQVPWTDRMEAALRHRGVTRPDRWLRGVRGDLDRALAETVTLTVDDVLLGRPARPPRRTAPRPPAAHRSLGLPRTRRRDRPGLAGLRGP